MPHRAFPLLALLGSCASLAPDPRFHPFDVEAPLRSDDIEESAPRRTGPDEGREPDDTESDRPSRNLSLDLGFQGSGLSFGNSRNWNGVRINFRDHGVGTVRGLNVGLWPAGKPAMERMQGLSIGAVPTADSMEGVALGILASVSMEESRGISVGGLASVSMDDGTGLGLGGLAVVSQGARQGIQIGGLAAVSERELRGLSLGGLACVSGESALGVQIGGLACVSSGSQEGVNIGGMAVVAQDGQRGITLGGLATVAGTSQTGLNVGGLAVVSSESLTGLHVAGLTVSAGEQELSDFIPDSPPTSADTSARGILVAGYRVQAGSIDGFTAAGVMNRCHELRGLGLGAFNAVSGHQTGLSIGLLNSAADLRGIQLGLLNHVATNPPWLRWLPLVNARF